MTPGSSKKGTDLFLISGKQIRAWRKECVKAINVRFDDPRCLGCEFVGTGVRYHCCDFDDNAMEKIFRSRPYNPEAEKQPSHQELVNFARWTQTFWKNGIEIMRKNNLVIKSDEPMEKLAFTFYTDLCEIDSKARHLFQEGYGEENYRNESAIECQTIKAYPKPYEEKIRRAAINGVLDRVRKELKACMDCEAWLKENQYVTWDDIEATLAELRQQQRGEDEGDGGQG